MGVQRPDWWCYPERCSNGHEWAPGRVSVSYTHCYCPPVRAAYGEEGDMGHLTVACQVPGARRFGTRQRMNLVLADTTSLWVILG